MPDQAAAAMNQTPPVNKAPQPVNPLDFQQKPQASQQSEVVKSIVSTESAGLGKTILGVAPKLDKSLLEQMVPPKSLLLTILKSAFGFLLVFSVASILFFTSQLTDKLEFATGDLPNTSKDLAATNQEITALQTDLNVLRFLMLKAYLDRFSQQGDSYVQFFDTANSQTAENADKNEATKQMKDLTASLRDSFTKIRTIFQKNFAAPLIDPKYADDTAALHSMYEQELRLALTNKAELFKDSTNEQGRREYKNYSQANELINNPAFAPIFLSADFDALSDQELYTFIKIVNGIIVNDLTIIQQIKNTRIKWSDIINEIDLRTVAVDKYFSGDLYDEVGGIRYTSYDFDTVARKISIIGETKRFDTTNFTMITELIDELNRSDFFEGADMRSFSKAGSLEDGYTASIKLGLNLQGEEITTADGLLNPLAVPEAGGEAEPTAETEF